MRISDWSSDVCSSDLHGILRSWRIYWGRMAKAVAAAALMGAEVQRIDKYLWFARLAKNRSVAQDMAETGHIRVNGRRIERAHASGRRGDLITFPHGRHVRVVRVLELAKRRGPASEAAQLYEEIGRAHV